MNSQDYSTELNKQIDDVLKFHPLIYDHRADYPWLTGYLGNPYAGMWFIAEIPSLLRVERASQRKNQVISEDTQWSESPGDKLFREMLFKHGFKLDDPFLPGGWNCYITNVIKQTSYVKDWEDKTQTAQRRTADIWSSVLSWELTNSKPLMVVVMGSKTKKLLEYLAANKKIHLPITEFITHYSYIGSRPQGKLGPMHPDRIRDYDFEFARIRNKFDALYNKNESLKLQRDIPSPSVRNLQDNINLDPAEADRIAIEAQQAVRHQEPDFQ